MNDAPHNPNDPPVALLGAGDHAGVLIEALRLVGRRVAVVMDDDPALHGGEIEGVRIVGEAGLAEHLPDAVELANAIGSVAPPRVRRDMFERYRAKGYRFATVVHPAAFVSPSAELGEGAQVMAGAVVQPHARLGDDCLVNTGATVDHDCVVGPHSHIAPGVTLCGGVRIGHTCHLGAGATVVQQRRIGDGSLVGAGAVVVRDLPAGCAAWGVPAVVRSAAGSTT